MFSIKTDERGRKLVAATHLKPFQTVASESSVAHAASSGHCQSCLGSHAKLQCSRCKAVAYCSSQCQRKDWTSHKRECPILCGSNSLGGNLVLFRLLLRLLPNATIDSVASLAANRDRFSDSTIETFGRLVVALTAKSSPMGPLPPTTMEPIPLIPSTATPADLILLLCKISCNSLGISDSSTFQECGVGLYPETISLLNHSCIPNCTIIFDKATTTARIVTLQEISIGQELTISYIDSADLFQTRHLELSTRYHFNCICPLCTTQTLEQNIWKCLSTPNCPGTITVEDPTPTTTTTTHCPHCKSVQPIAERTKSFKSLSRKDAQNDLTQQLQLLTLQLQTYPEYATTNGTYSSSSSSNNNNNNKNSRSRNKNTAAIILKTRQQLYNLYLGYQNWHLAFQICRDLINDLQLLYPKMSPALGLQYLAGARLGLLMTDEKRNVDLKELREWAHEAVVIFDGLLGWNHVLTQEAREKREEIGVLHSM